MGKKNKLIMVNPKLAMQIVGKRSTYFFILSIGNIFMFVIMHIEKNVCESIIGTLLNSLGKTNDGLNCHLDLVDMGLRSELAPMFESKRTYLPPTCYTLSKMEKKRYFAKLVHN